MKVWTVEALKGGSRDNHCYIVGVYPTEGVAYVAAKQEEYDRCGRYECIIAEWEVPDEKGGSEDIDLQQQVEVLQAYVDVLQGYTVVLKDAMMMVLEVPAIRANVGEKTTELLTRDLSKGSRTTWDDETRQYIKEK